MSNLTKTAEQECDVIEGCGAIKVIIEPKQKELGGFSVRRALPSREQQMVGPWIFFDHMGPADFPAGQGIDVRPHPHIGIATVTYLFEGEILHRDSLGSDQPIRPGDINLMVAGRGIVHSERERPEWRAADHRLHGLQLWLALPQALEEIEPAFHHYPSAELPALEVDGVPIRVIMGSAYGVTSPVKTFATTLYVEAHLQPGQTITLPDADERAVYVASGRLKARETEIPEYALAVFDKVPGVVLEAAEESRIAIIGGEPFSKHCIVWNFVSSRAERIDQAVEDWKAGRFPKVPGDEKEFIPFPDK
ncbi:pirin family protein [Microbulbifer hainanensis]|uniref:pirin family protein n=1 Tax=Microbulbifer hainanensis TaxID=2735675 RepID=UPI001868B63C|nr:pirin family protein [Microbulbifer hainanensis]